MTRCAIKGPELLKDICTPKMASLAKKNELPNTCTHSSKHAE